LAILLIKKADFNIKSDKFKLGAAVFETAGQFFYVFAMAGNAVIAAPLVASYCIFSIIFSMIFLKERLSWRKWLAVGLVVISIILLGISEGLAA
jgi:drug/metabolite transporter (DMT)-like permease